MTSAVPVTATKGFTALRDEIIFQTEKLVQTLKQVNAVPIRLGCDPIAFADDRCRTTTQQRYIKVPDFHRRHRRVGMPVSVGLGEKQVRVDAPTVVGTTSSVQFNMDCYSAEEAIKLLNRSFAPGAYTVAFSANARFLDGMDTGFADIRGVLWHMSHDIRTYGELFGGMAGRTGLPRNYYADLFEYFADVHDQPSILHKEEAAFPLALGLFWRESRLKFLRLGENDQQIVLEFRPLSLQANSINDYAFLAFAIGHIIGCENLQLPLLPFSYVHDNCWQAMISGLDDKLWIVDRAGNSILVDAKSAFELEFDRAKLGLSFLGANAEEIAEVEEVWRQSLVRGSPSEQFFSKIKGQSVSREILCEVILNR